MGVSTKQSLQIIESLLVRNTQNLNQLVNKVKLIDEEPQSLQLDDRQLLSILMQLLNTDKYFTTAKGFVLWCYEHNIKCTKKSDIKRNEMFTRLEEKWLHQLHELMIDESPHTINVSQCIHLIRCYSFLLESNSLWKFYENFRRETLLQLLDKNLQTDSTDDLQMKIYEFVERDGDIFHEIFPHQQIIDLYYDILVDFVEKSIKQMEPALAMTTTNQPLDACSKVKSDSKEIVLLSLNEETASVNSSPELPSLVKAVQAIQICDKLEKCLKNESSRPWDWSSLFVPLSSEIGRWVEKQIRAVTSTFQQEIDHLDTKNHEFTQGFTPSVCDVVQSLTDLALACDQKLIFIINSISIGLKQMSSDIVNHLLKSSQKNSKSKNVLYVLLNSAVDFSIVFEKTHVALQVRDIVSLKSECQQLVDLSSSLKEQIKYLHKTLLLTGVFHDAESHDWQNPAAFSQDNPVSFSVRMWCLFMRSFRGELAQCPPKEAQEVFTHILSFSLSWFTQRYGRAKPSASRLDQFRSDITTILLNTSEFLFVCGQTSLTNIIHEHCNTLLATAVIICAPLAALHETYKDGFRELKWGLTEWLSVLRPDFWTTNCIQSEVSFAMHLKSVCLQFEPHWPTVIKLLVLNDGALPMMMLSDAVETNTGFGTAKSVLDVLLNCQVFPYSLGKTLMHIIKKYKHWKEILWFTSCNEQFPFWVQIMDEQLERFCLPIILPITLKLLQLESLELFYEYSLTANQLTSIGTKRDCKLDLSLVAEQLIDQSTAAFCTLPIPLQLFFVLLQNELSETEKENLVAKSAYLHMFTMKCCRLLISCVRKLSEVDDRMELRRFTDELVQNVRSKKETEIDGLFSNLEIENWNSDEQTCIIAAAQMTSNKEAYTSLKQFYNCILSNQQWILLNMGYNTQQVFSNSKESSINPLHESCRISSSTRFEYAWQDLVDRGLGLKEMSFRLLLVNRWEMQNENQLSLQQQEVVQLLKSLYGFEEELV